MSFTLQVSSTSSILSANFFPPIYLDRPYEVALIGLSSWNSIANITKENNIFWYDEDKKIELPIGSYELEDLERYLAEEMRSEHEKNPLPETAPKELQQQAIYISPNRQSLRSVIYSRYKIDFTRENNLSSLLGFNPAKLDAFKKYESENLVNIMQVESIKLECNIVSGSFTNGRQSHTIYEFFLSTPPGYRIVQNPTHVIYLPLSTSVIDNIEIRLCDQNNKSIDLRGESTVALLHFRKCQ